MRRPIFRRSRFTTAYREDPLYTFRLVAEPKQEKAVKQTTNNDMWDIFSFGNLAKFFASITVLSGVLGVCYQKGMIANMQLGNMSGSYEVKEVFSSALSAYYSLFDTLFKSKSETFFDEHLIIYFSLSYLALMFWIYVFLNRMTVRSKIEKSKSYFRKLKLKRSPVNYALVVAISSLCAVIFKVFSMLFKIVVLALFAILLIPSIIGYQLGKNDALKVAKKDVCFNQDKDIGTEKTLRQCTHLVINGKTLRGEILLQNSDGYFMRINNAFVFASKDGNTCIYSQDKRGPVKVADNFKFENEQLDSFCVPGKS